MCVMWVTSSSDPSFVMEALHRPVACHLATKVLCPCVDGSTAMGRQKMRETVDLFRQELRDLVRMGPPQYKHVLDATSSLVQVESGRYEGYDDFAVLLQPGLHDLRLPKAANETILGHSLPDLSYLAPNCLYPSQKMQALSESNCS